MGTGNPDEGDAFDRRDLNFNFEVSTEHLAALDQMGANLRGMVGPISEYYNALLKSGLPDGLVYSLVQQFHRSFWESAFDQNTHRGRGER